LVLICPAIATAQKASKKHEAARSAATSFFGFNLP